MAPKKAAGHAAPGSASPPDDLLQDLCSRFILNCPAEELQSFERILFLVEQAHWFYEDFCRTTAQGRALRSFSLREFAELMFEQHPSLEQHKARLDGIYKQFTTYKHNVPVFGAIMVNPALDKCLMVKGWKSGASWGFPKGKVNKEEEDAPCAAREVYEETGFDITPLIVERDFIEVTSNQQRTKLYIVANVDEQTGFAPQTRKEISQIAWHWIEDLPFSGGAQGQGTDGKLKYFMVHPFVLPLRQWVARRQGKPVPQLPRALPPAPPPARQPNPKPAPVSKAPPAVALKAAPAPQKSVPQPQKRAPQPRPPPPPAPLPAAAPRRFFPKFKLDVDAVMRAYDRGPEA